MIPPGWRLIPEEPTDAMLSATMLDGHWSYPEAISGNPADWVRGAYRVMLEASPPLPEIGDEMLEKMCRAQDSTNPLSFETWELFDAHHLNPDWLRWRQAKIASMKAALSVLSDDTGGTPTPQTKAVT